MLEHRYNHDLCFRLASTPGEVINLLARLPATVTADLIKDLEVGDEAEKYDLATQTAYAFTKLGIGLSCWSWSDVRSYNEAARLLAAIVELREALNPLLACQLYTDATNRPSVLDPEHMPRDGEAR